MAPFNMRYVCRSQLPVHCWLCFCFVLCLSWFIACISINTGGKSANLILLCYVHTGYHSRYCSFFLIYSGCEVNSQGLRVRSKLRLKWFIMALCPFVASSHHVGSGTDKELSHFWFLSVFHFQSNITIFQKTPVPDISAKQFESLLLFPLENFLLCMESCDCNTHWNVDRCKTCGEYIYKGKKFNARKETVQNELYMGLPIFRFYIKCTRCLAEITFKVSVFSSFSSINSSETKISALEVSTSHCLCHSL